MDPNATDPVLRRKQLPPRMSKHKAIHAAVKEMVKHKERERVLDVLQTLEAWHSRCSGTDAELKAADDLWTATGLSTRRTAGGGEVEMTEVLRLDDDEDDAIDVDAFDPDVLTVKVVKREEAEATVQQNNNNNEDVLHPLVKVEALETDVDADALARERGVGMDLRQQQADVEEEEEEEVEEEQHQQQQEEEEEEEEKIIPHDLNLDIFCENYGDGRYAHLVTEWAHPTEPMASFSRGIETKVPWNCGKGDCGHEWEAKVGNRTRSDRPAGCPQCYKLAHGRPAATDTDNLKVFCENSDGRLAHLLTEWAHPTEPMAGFLRTSEKKVPWKCGKGDCGHEWEAQIRHRTKKSDDPSGCPKWRNHRRQGE